MLLSHAGASRSGAVTVVLSALLLDACLDPTQIELVITTDLLCEEAELKSTGIVAAAPADLDERRDTAAQAHGCRDGYIGRLIAIPSGADNEQVAFKIASTADDQVPVVGCLGPELPDKCIVARRSLRYVPHTPLTLPIAMRRACLGVVCPPGETCVDGTCRSASVDPGQCTGDGCGEQQLPPGQPRVPMPGPEPVPPNASWALHFTGTDTVDGRAVVVRPGRDVFVAGNFDPDIAFGDGTTHSVSADGVFVAQFSASGVLQWSRVIASGGGAELITMVGDSAGALYVAGSYGGPYSTSTGFQLGDEPIPTGVAKAAFLARVDPEAGDLVWQSTHTSTGDVTLLDLDVDDHGLYVVGAFDGTVTLNSASGMTVVPPLIAYDDGTDLLVALLDPNNGDVAWNVSSESPGRDGATGVAVDVGGKLHVDGIFTGNLRMGVVNLPAHQDGPQDGFHVTIDPQTRDVLAGASLRGAYDETPTSTARAGEVTPCTGGFFREYMRFGDIPVQSALDPTNFTPDAFVGCFDDHSLATWARGLAAASTQHVALTALAGDAAGRLFLTGTFGGSLQLYPDTPLSTATAALFVAALDAASPGGPLLWSTQLPSSSPDATVGAAPNAIAADAPEAVYVTGSLDSELTVGQQTIGPAAGSGHDAFLIRLLPELP